MSTSADFYIGTGDTATWLGHISRDGTPAEMDEFGLFGGSTGENRYEQDTFRTIAWDIVSESDDGDSVWTSPEYPDRPEEFGPPDFVYAFVTGSVHVFEQGVDMSGTDGMLLVAVHHPNGARKVTGFKGLVVL